MPIQSKPSSYERRRSRGPEGAVNITVNHERLAVVPVERDYFSLRPSGSSKVKVTILPASPVDEVGEVDDNKDKFISELLARRRARGAEE